MKKYFIGLLILFSSCLAFCQAQLPLLQTENTYFVRADTKQKVVLKGVGISNNAWGFYEWPISDSLQKAGVNPLIRARELKPFVFTSEDVARIGQLDGNIVRYCFNDELFRADNPKRQANLTQMRSHISQLAAKGIYSIVTMQINPGLDCHNDNFERNKPPLVRLKSPFENDSVFKLWRDTWQFVARGLEDVNAVAGYELIVEPRRPSLADASEQKLIKTYVEVIDSIRSADKRHIVMVPEYNSSEANPGEQYWSETAGSMVTDNGEQGIIWGRNWLQLPSSISNMVYVAHLYGPYEFTTGKTASTFDANELQNTAKQTADWAYNQNRPLYVSEYGVNYFHTMNGADHKRNEWLKTIHDAFDERHVSSTIFQYKDLLTPWVKMDGTFGIWQHYYDESTIKSVSGGKIEYSDEQTHSAAIDSKVDIVLNQYFIENAKFKNISTVQNQSLIDELNRYFKSQVSGLTESSVTPSAQKVYTDRGMLYFKDLPAFMQQMHVTVFEPGGKELMDTNLIVQEGKAQMSLSRLEKTHNLVLLKYGNNGEWSEKLILP